MSRFPYLMTVVLMVVAFVGLAAWDFNGHYKSKEPPTAYVMTLMTEQGVIELTTFEEPFVRHGVLCWRSESGLQMFHGTYLVQARQVSLQQ